MYIWIATTCFIFSFYLVGHSARKRRRGSENIDIEERLESLITRVGEKVHTYYIIYIYISLHLIKSFYNCRLTSIKHYILFIKGVNILFQSTSSLESNLEGLASVLEADLQNYKTKILRILCSWSVVQFSSLTRNLIIVSWNVLIPDHITHISNFMLMQNVSFLLK